MKKYMLIFILQLFIGCHYYQVKQSQTALLNSAYKNQSLELLDKFLTNWEKHQTEFNIQKSNNNNDTVKNIYEIYELLYDPLEWNKNYPSESNLARSYNGVRNIIIPTEIEYFVVDSLMTTNQLLNMELRDGAENIFKPSTLHKNKIENFFPSFKREGIRILYLIPLYKNLLNQFLELKEHRYNKKKLEFLGELTSIQHGHWGGYFLTSPPLISTIRFNEKMTRAIAQYRSVGGGGDIILKRENNKWIKVGYGGAWVE